MGTSGSYTGGGGEAGSDLRDGVSEWLDSLPAQAPAPAGGGDGSGDGTNGDGEGNLPQLDPQMLSAVVGLFARTRGGHSDGPGGGGGGSGGAPGARSTTRTGGAQRTIGRSAATAGRAAAGAYAYRTGDAATLRRLGLDYDALRATNDPLEIASQIVQAAADAVSDGTIEDGEWREVASSVALWVLTENEAGAPPELDEIARYALAEILYEAMLGESAAVLNDGSRLPWATVEGERQMRQAAEVIAAQAELSPGGATPEEFERAITEGLVALQMISRAG